MSMMLMVRAMNVKVGSAATKLVLLKLADNANDSGICYPSYQDMAEHCEMDRRTVMRHVEKLKNMGLVNITYRKDPDKKLNKSNVYQLTLDAKNVSAVDSKNQGSDILTPPKNSKSSDKMTLGVVSEDHHPSDKMTLGGSDRVSPRTSQSTTTTTNTREPSFLKHSINMNNLPEKDVDYFSLHELNEDELPQWAEKSPKVYALVTNSLEVWRGFVLYNKANRANELITIQKLLNMWEKRKMETQGIGQI